MHACTVCPSGTDAIFIQNLFQAHKKHARVVEARTRPLPTKANPNKTQAVPIAKPGAQREKFSGFTVDHYAGKVTYNSEFFLDKNADFTHPDTITLFTSSECGVTKQLLSAPSADDKGPRRAFQSLGSSFSKQLQSLMEMLRSTTPHFVRCINPNQFKRARTFDNEYVRPQLRCGGLIEALRVLKLGYPSRCPYSDIYARFGHLLSRVYGDNLNQKDFTEAVFVAFGLDAKDYQLGLTKVFFRPGKQEFLETVLGQNPQLTQDMVNKIRSLMVRRRLRRVKYAVLQLVRFQTWINKARAFRRISDMASVVLMISLATKDSLTDIKRVRGALSLQSAIRCAVDRRRVFAKLNAVKCLQKCARCSLRL